MPRKKHRKNNATAVATSDFTIHDFADSNIAISRPKKAYKNVVTSQLPPATLLGNNEDKLWDEDDSEGETEIETEGHYEIMSIPKNISENEPLGVHYPSTLWFLVSEYILPEDVGRFAGICKTTHYTTTLAKFWSDLYKRHCKPFKSKLPQNLQPECLTRRHGLRSLVIRSLYHTYPPFANRPPSSQLCTSEELLKCRCACVWFFRVKSKWCLFFKMVSSRHPVRKLPKNIMDLLDDVHANSQSSYKVLKVTCGSFTECTSAMGMTLTVMKASIGSNMRSSHLLLGFSHTARDLPTLNVMLDDVVKTDVHDWWHPQYPHPGELLPASSVAHPNKFNFSIDSVD